MPLAKRTTCVCVPIGTEPGPNQYITGPEACGGTTGVASLCTNKLCEFATGMLAQGCCVVEENSGSMLGPEIAAYMMPDPFTFYV